MKFKDNFLCNMHACTHTRTHMYAHPSPQHTHTHNFLLDSVNRGLFVKNGSAVEHKAKYWHSSDNTVPWLNDQHTQQERELNHGKCMCGSAKIGYWCWKFWLPHQAEFPRWCLTQSDYIQTSQDLPAKLDWSVWLSNFSSTIHLFENFAPHPPSQHR